MTNLERINSIAEDLDDVSIQHPDLPTIPKYLIEEDIPWLIEYVQKVENFIKIVESPQIESVTFMGGYMSAIRDLKRELNEITP